MERHGSGAFIRDFIVLVIKVVAINHTVEDHC